MKTLRIAASWLAVLLLVGGQPAGAEPSRVSPKPMAERKEERKVRVTVNEVVSIAIGESAVAHTRLANKTAQSAGSQAVTIRIGKIAHKAVGPKASACIQIPFVADPGTCE